MRTAVRLAMRLSAAALCGLITVVVGSRINAGGKGRDTGSRAVGLGSLLRTTDPPILTEGLPKSSGMQRGERLPQRCANGLPYDAYEGAGRKVPRTDSSRTYLLGRD